MNTNTKTKTNMKTMLASCIFLAGVSALQAKENVLLIIADDLGVDSLGLYSDIEVAPTPNIDNLAAEGVRFTNAWANPSCTPTRASLLTGRYGFRTGVGAPGDQILRDEFTIPMGLSTEGYDSGCFGKWHLAGNRNGGDTNPAVMGFTRYEGAISGGLADYFNYPEVTVRSANLEAVTTTITNYATSETVDDALRWIGNRGDTPWYCQVAFNAPHEPYHLPPEDLHSSDLSGTNGDINNNPRAYYNACLLYTSPSPRDRG